LRFLYNKIIKNKPLTIEIDRRKEMTTLVALERIVVIFILAGFLGWQRERENKPAGFRTHILVGLGSALTMMTGIYLMEQYPDLNLDPARIAAQVISGVGFLGAGTIIKEKGSVVGLTTASCIWLVACVGLAVGVGFYVGAIGISLLSFVSLSKHMNFHNKHKEIHEEEHEEDHEHQKEE
jgi:putative Mg2+ transporter-C (MgtC) family protein